MRRRNFIQGVAAATAWPLGIRAQQASMPVIGYLSSFPSDTSKKFTQAFRDGLKESGFVEGDNVTIEYRLVDAAQYDRLPMEATDLIHQQVAVLFASPINAAMAAKRATTSTPIVFAVGSDPVDMRLVETLNQPGGNATGATFLSVELGNKRLELLRDIIPKIGSVAFLVNPENPTTATQTKDMRGAATTLGLKFRVVDISSAGDLEDVFAKLDQPRPDAVVVSADAIFWGLRDQLIALAARYSLPTVYFAREFVAAGGLVSYNSDYADSIRKAGTYVGLILKGEKPANLPVLQPTKFELVINLKTAKALGLTIPQTLQATADDVIE